MNDQIALFPVVGFNVHMKRWWVKILWDYMYSCSNVVKSFFSVMTKLNFWNSPVKSLVDMRYHHLWFHQTYWKCLRNYMNEKNHVLLDVCLSSLFFFFCYKQSLIQFPPQEKSSNTKHQEDGVIDTIILNVFRKWHHYKLAQCQGFAKLCGWNYSANLWSI